MKIAIIDVNYTSSSTGEIVKDISNYLISSGHEVKVYFGRGKNHSLKHVIRISSLIEVFFHAILGRIIGINGFFSPFATYTLLKKINRFKPDIVHLHDLHGYYVNIYSLIKYLKKNKITVIWTLHCDYMFTGGCASTITCSKWMNECKSCPNLNYYPKSYLFDQTKFKFLVNKSYFHSWEKLNLVAPSQWQADRINLSILKKFPINVIKNGVNHNVFKKINDESFKNKYNNNNSFIVLIVGSNILSPLKGGKYVYELAKKFNNENIKFIIVGEKKRSKEAYHNVLHIPFTNKIELAKFYSLANILLLTSIQESFSMVVAESLSCGTPVVGFNCGAPLEIAPIGYGEFVEYGNIDSLFILLRLIYSGEKKLKNSSECIKFAKLNYSSEQMVQKYYELYKEVVCNQLK